MEILAALFIWPFLILAVFLVALAFGLMDPSYVVLLIIFFIVLAALFTARKGGRGAPALSRAEEFTKIRETAIVFCISLFLPLFARYLVGAFDHSLGAVIAVLALGFGMALWGLFLKGNRMLVYANLIGGGLTLIYAYFEIWALGDLARVIATAFGLCVAVAFSIIKLKEKLQ